MEMNEVYSNMRNGNSAKIFEKTGFPEHVVPETYANGVHGFSGNGISDSGRNFRQKQQQEDRILFRQVPKRILEGPGTTLNQPSSTFRVLNLDFDRKFRVRLPSAGNGRPGLTLELESPASQVSSLSECSPLSSEICDDSPIAAAANREEHPNPVFDRNIENPPTSENASTKSPEESIAAESLEMSAVTTEDVTTPRDTELTGPSEEGGEEGGEGEKKEEREEKKDEKKEEEEGATDEKRPVPHAGSFCEEDTEFDFLKATHVRRCSSLKISSVASDNKLGKKKEVRFADALGLDLESVKHIVATTEPPTVPPTALRGLRAWDRSIDGTAKDIKQVLQLCPCFSPPGSSERFASRVDEQKVALETLAVDDANLAVTGSICVVNIAYVKNVGVRFTTNGWLSHSDVDAAYLGASNEGRIDRFIFKIGLPKSFGFGNRLEFAIFYETMNQVYWDNNFKVNYRVECYYKQVS